MTCNVIYAPHEVWELFVMGIQRDHIDVALNDETLLRLLEETFAYAIVEAGTHSVSYGHESHVERLLLDRKGGVEFEVPEGETVYVEIGWSGDPELADEEAAGEHLRQLRHHFRDTLPFNH